MDFTYNNKDYALMQAIEPTTGESTSTTDFSPCIDDMIIIFKIKYVMFKGLELLEISKKEYENNADAFVKYEFINYFYDQCDNNENIGTARVYIDKFENKQ